jgi:hypothetical protein
MRQDNQRGRRVRWNGEEACCQFPIALDFVGFDVGGSRGGGDRRRLEDDKGQGLRRACAAGQEKDDGR